MYRVNRKRYILGIVRPQRRLRISHVTVQSISSSEILTVLPLIVI